MGSTHVSPSIIEQIDLGGTVYVLRRKRGDYLSATIERGDSERFLGAQDSETPTGMCAELGMTTTSKTLGEALEIARSKGLAGVWLLLSQEHDFQVFRV